ncbi:MFS transporter [Corynebacterium glutamicum]|nr:MULTISPECIES: MFS transporter [Corynebacterium]WFP71872.1 MFS transporter [Corynebacterium glutamicum]
MSSGPPESATPQIKYGLLVGTLASAGITVSLAQTLVIPIIGRLPEIFNTTAANASWIITVTLLVGAVATPVMGRLADMYSKKKMMLISLVPFILGSVICAVSADLIPMIIGRGFQGLGSGLIPFGISLMHDLLPGESRVCHCFDEFFHGHWRCTRSTAGCCYCPVCVLAGAVLGHRSGSAYSWRGHLEGDSC